MSTKMKMSVSYRVIRLGLLLTVTFTATVVQSCTMKEVVKKVYSPWHPDRESIAIRTNSAIGSAEKVDVLFHDDNYIHAGSVIIKFNSLAIQYQIGWCSQGDNAFPGTLPTQTDKVWKIVYNHAELRLVIHCNGMVVLDVVLSNSVCDRTNLINTTWRTYWTERKPTRISFGSGLYDTYTYTDTASDAYCVDRRVDQCTGLDPAWTNLTTETTFPVFQGTVVEVTCDEGYGLVGSSTVTCNKNTTFTYDNRPSCRQLLGINGAQNLLEVLQNYEKEVDKAKDKTEEVISELDSLENRLEAAETKVDAAEAKLGDGQRDMDEVLESIKQARDDLDGDGQAPYTALYTYTPWLLALVIAALFIVYVANRRRTQNLVISNKLRHLNDPVTINSDVGDQDEEDEEDQKRIDLQQNVRFTMV